MTILVVAEESTECVDFFIINFIDGNYDTTGLHGGRVENIFAIRKWCVRRGVGEVDTRTRSFFRTYSQGSHYVAWKLTTLVATSRAVSKTVVGCTLTIGRAYSRLSVGIRYQRCNHLVYGSCQLGR